MIRPEREREEETHSQTSNDGSHDVEHFGITSGGKVLLVVSEDGVEKSRDERAVDLVEILGLLDVSLDELEDLLLDRTKSSNLGSLGGDETWKEERERDDESAKVFVRTDDEEGNENSPCSAMVALMIPLTAL